MKPLLWFLLVHGALAGARVKELAALEGVRDNQLVGYGVVVGLAGTGDRRQTVFSAQSLANLIQRFNVAVNPAAIQVKNTAAVLVTANLPPFAQPGTRVDVTVAAIGDATNLQGGQLILTPLRSATGQVFAAAQGAVVTGGFVAGRGGNTQVLNHPTTGRIPSGALVEQSPPSAMPSTELRLQLRSADFTTAARLAQAVNQRFPASQPLASAKNAGLVVVSVPTERRDNIAQFIGDVEALTVEADRPQRIVINERTGTITLGSDVRIRPVTVLHGALTVEVRTVFEVSQPAPLSQGQTVVVPQVSVGVKEEKAQNLSLNQGATVEELVKGLKAIGATARDVIAILQSLRSAGALDAEIEVM